jgi:IclR family pca regulon transcriptional regulator
MLGYVAQVPGTRRFRLRLRCLDLGCNMIARASLRVQARPILRDLVGELNEAASIGVLDGVEVVCIERIQAGIARLGVDVRLASRVLVYSSAIGRAILAFLPRETQIAVLEARPREKRTEVIVTDREVLRVLLDRVRADDIAFSDQKTVLGLRVLPCALIAADGLPALGRGRCDHRPPHPGLRRRIAVGSSVDRLEDAQQAPRAPRSGNAHGRLARRSVTPRSTSRP